MTAQQLSWSERVAISSHILADKHQHLEIGTQLCDSLFGSSGELAKHWIVSELSMPLLLEVVLAEAV